MSFMLRWLVTLIGILHASLAMSQSGNGLDKRTPNAYFNVESESLAHKSDTIGGTDFGVRFAWNVGAWTGKSKNFGLGIHQDISNMTYSQVDGTLTTAWTDFSMQYRLWWFYPKLAFGSCTFISELNGVTTVDALCTTAGGGLGIRIPIGPLVIANADVSMMNPTVTKDASGNNAAVGSRLDFTAGALLYPKAEWIEIAMGVRYRSFSVDVNGSTFKEVVAGAYVGLGLGITF